MNARKNTPPRETKVVRTTVRWPLLGDKNCGDGAIEG